MCSEEKDKFKASVEERNKKNSVGANNVVKENLESDSTKDLADNPVQRGPTHSKPEPETGRKMSTSQRSQIGPESPPPDAAPRLPPKPGECRGRLSRNHKSNILIINVTISYQ